MNVKNEYTLLLQPQPPREVREADMLICMVEKERKKGSGKKHLHWIHPLSHVVKKSKAADVVKQYKNNTARDMVYPESSAYYLLWG